ncbi:MAG: UbiH/UbiF/VisC/COQ6 family ubiquinone biosynthesis hydroxylase [Gammaproteobacteria bacterium]|nr:UbiH/UbiF/VisC/COQ6 family ubiquinone biosynthesis hydroxylase [Gammaproteobacteria bacterium]
MDYDIVITGAGMVGAALACALGSSGLRIAVIEAQPLPAEIHPGDEYDLRVSAITRASQRIFESMGAWDSMRARRVSPFRDMHVWDATGNGEIHFDSAEIGEDTLGHIIENRVIQLALLERMRALDNVELILPARLMEFATHTDSVELRLDDGRCLTARLAVGADGAESHLRRLAGIATRGWKYQQKALVATVQTELPHRETAWQRFLPTGPLAFLPLADGRSSIVWSTTPEQADALLAMDERSFLAELERAFDAKLGRMIASPGPRAAFPLRLQHATAYTALRIALIGDAAHIIHPLAGQGVNLGLLDAATLAEVVLDAQRAGKDIGALATLRRYERRRKGGNLAMMAAMDGFKRLFGNDLVPLKLLRNIGLNLTNAATPVKNVIVRHAMGLSGDLPRMARRCVS